jgi:acetyl esterase/lipase
MYLYLLRPDEKREKALPAIVYFTGGGWVSGNVEGQIPNNLVIHNPVERNKR